MITCYVLHTHDYLSSGIYSVLLICVSADNTVSSQNTSFVICILLHYQIVVQTDMSCELVDRETRLSQQCRDVVAVPS